MTEIKAYFGIRIIMGLVTVINDYCTGANKLVLSNGLITKIITETILMNMVFTWHVQTLVKYIGFQQICHHLVGRPYVITFLDIFL